MKIKQYEARVHSLVGRISPILAASEGREFTAEERTQLDGPNGNDGLRAQLATAKADLAMARDMEESERLLAGQGTAGDDGSKQTSAPSPFGNLGSMLQAVRRSSQPGAAMDSGLAQIQAAGTGMNEGIPAEGGFLVQTDMATDLYRQAWESGQISSRTRRRPLNGNRLLMNAVDESSRADGSRDGGIQAYWTGEAGSYTGTKPKLRQVDLKLEKLTGLYYATDELMEDASALEAEVASWFRDEFSFKLDDAVFRGNGAGMPLGFTVAGCFVTQAAEGGQTADTIVAGNVQKMFSRMRPRDLTNAVWLINTECWPQLFAMTQGNNAIFLPGGNLANAPFGTLLGRPIVPVEQCAALGDVGDIVLTNLDQYLMIEKAAGLQVATSIHVAFLTGEQTFRFTLRANGQPLPSSAVTPFKGSATTSPFVALAAR